MAYPLFHPESDQAPPTQMTRSAFRAAFPLESDYVERKTGIGSGPLQDAVVAFSNADGGVTLIGVDDAGRVVGKELTQGTADAIHELLRTVHDPGRYSIHPLEVAGVNITVLSVARRIGGFAQTSNGRVMVRRGTHKVALFGDELRQFIMERSLQRFESSDSGVAFARADPELIAALAAAFSWSEDAIEERLRERGLVTGTRRSPKLTVAGALYLLRDPSDPLGKAYIEILRYPEGSTDYDRRVEVDGPVNEQLEEATQFVADELGSELVVLGVRRHDIARLPVVVLREAIANALAHRAYELNGSSVRIELRPESVSVLSPGSLPEPVTVDNIRETQAARNLDVISVLRRLGLAEDAGRGVDVMVDSMRQELLDPPTFVDTGHSVEVTLPIRSAVAPAERAWVREVEDRGLIEPADRIVLIHAARGEALTNARVRELLNVDAFQARESLHRLRDAGFLTQRGRHGGATYVLGDALSPPLGLRLSPTALRDVLVEMAGEEPLTNAKVRLRTGLDRAEALRLLDDLVTEGRLVRIGERRGSRYVLPEDRDRPTPAA